MNGAAPEASSWNLDLPFRLVATLLLAVAGALLLRWILVVIASRYTSRLHCEPGYSLRNWRVSLSFAVVAGLVGIAWLPDVESLRMLVLGVACTLLAVTGFFAGADFREYGLMVGGVLLPWSRVRKVSWIDGNRTSLLIIHASWSFPLAVRVDSKNQQAVDRLVKSAARYERYPVFFWLRGLLISSFVSLLVVAAVVVFLNGGIPAVLPFPG